jgi:hypothetical protein
VTVEGALQLVDLAAQGALSNEADDRQDERQRGDDQREKYQRGLHR